MNILESIVQYDVAAESDSQAYNNLVITCYNAGINGKQEWESTCRGYEDEYMATFHADTEGAQKKDGSWKYRTLLPGAYTSAKSVIGSALDAGIPIVDSEINPIGKSALQKQINTSKAEDKEEKTNLEKVQVMLDSIGKIVEKSDSAERSAINSAILDLYMDI